MISKPKQAGNPCAQSLTQDSNCEHSGDKLILLEQGSKAKEQFPCYFKSVNHVSTCTSIPSLAWGPGVQRKKLSLYSKLQIQLGLLLLPKRQLLFLFFLNNNPLTFKLLKSCFTPCFKIFNTTVGNIIPKRHISGTEMLLCRSKEVCEIHRGGCAKQPGKRTFKHVSGSQLIPDIQTEWSSGRDFLRS